MTPKASKARAETFTHAQVVAAIKAWFGDMAPDFATNNEVYLRDMRKALNAAKRAGQKRKTTNNGK